MYQRESHNSDIKEFTLFRTIRYSRLEYSNVGFHGIGRVNFIRVEVCSHFTFRETGLFNSKPCLCVCLVVDIHLAGD